MTALLRSFLLWLSRQRALGDALERVPWGRRGIGRFVAGQGPDEAITTARALIAKGFSVTFSRLGEDVESEAEATAATAEYRALVDAVAGAGLASASKVAIKPTLLGLKLGPAMAAGNLERVLEASRWAGVAVELDMERSDSVDDTLALYRAAVATTPDLGVAIQAYLRRSEADVEALIADGLAHCRIVKGAYAEPAAVAYAGAAEIGRRYRALVKQLLAPAAQESGAWLAVATHDLPLIAATHSRAYRQQTPPDRWEVQMLYGVRQPLQDRLRREGYAVRVYLPYGEHWYPYFLRRLAERPGNLMFALRALVGR